MTSALKQPQLKTSRYHLYHIKFEQNFLKKYQKRGKIRPAVAIYGGAFFEKSFTGKELDAETGLYYYGARYLDPRISRWLSVDPAMYEGDYLPSAPVSDEARQRNQNLPGMGGIYNYVNFHVYHYAGNNPVKFVDPDGRKIIEPFVMFRQSDPRFNGVFLGGEESYDDKARTRANSMTHYGCLYMAAVSIGYSILKESVPTEFYKRFNITRYTRSDFELLFNPLRFNIRENFYINESNANGGEDVFLLDIENIIRSASSRNIKVERINNNFVEKLMEYHLSEQSYYIIADFSVWGGSHFVPLDSISINDNGSIRLNYREQYAPFIARNMRFTIRNLRSLRVVSFDD